MVPWPRILKSMVPGCECDFFLFNNLQELSERPPAPVSDYDFQLVGIPLRSVLPDKAYFRLSYAHSKAYEALFLEARDRLSRFLTSAMRWNKEYGLLTFVTNFLLPQQSPMGRLLPRYDLRNLVYFVEKLNEALAEELRDYPNAYLFDFDQVIATFGRKYFQDDIINITNHNAALSDYDFEFDTERLERPVKASSLYPLKTPQYYQLGWTELLAMYRTIRQFDMVKLVVVDIDDTLWRGVAVERAKDASDVIEGWPIGLAEALGHLKRRGILLAVVSKNEEKLILPIWQRLLGDRLAPEDFAVRKINWRPKAENFEEILQETNLLPRNVLYIDDNPVERASIKAAFPDVRTFGPNPLIWRRILLWSAETQVSTITSESSARTEMVRAQVERETQREQLSREDFLATLDVEVALREIEHIEHPDFPRVLELVNKSNQFNTTGRRWTKQECMAALGGDMRFFIFDAKDKFTSYGIIGVVLCEGSNIVQFVMSCRVVGLEIENAAIAALLRIIHEKTGEETITAELEETELNLLARDLWKRCGFQFKVDRWVRSLSPELPQPTHIKMLDHATA